MERRLALETCHAAIWVLLKAPRILTDLMLPELVKSEAAEGMAERLGSTAAKMRLPLALPASRVSMEVAARMAEAVRLPTLNFPSVLTPTSSLKSPLTLSDSMEGAD